MHRHYHIDTVDRTIRDLMQSRKLFGGKVVLFSAKLRLILPVFEGRSRPQITHACFKTSPVYRQFPTLQFSNNVRLTALRIDANPDADALSFLSLFCPRRRTCFKTWRGLCKTSSFYCTWIGCPSFLASHAPRHRDHLRAGWLTRKTLHSYGNESLTPEN